MKSAKTGKRTALKAEKLPKIKRQRLDLNQSKCGFWSSIHRLIW